jgi:ATP-dependent DNA helicase PIF1
MEGRNLFFTGSAGTGKSVLLRAIIKALSERSQMAGQVSGLQAPGGVSRAAHVFAQSNGSRLQMHGDGRSSIAITASTGVAAM